VTSRALRTIVALLAVAALAACGGDDDTNAAPTVDEGTVEVTVQTFDFQPDPLTVEAGTTITFRNLDKINHSVTAGTREAPTPDDFDGLMEDAGATFELTLDEPGTYDYFCRFHPGAGMTGQIVVE
jgi:plastocyanin